jgi:pyruvate/oxaloacetate carboxyltransferase
MNVADTVMTWERVSDNKIVHCEIHGGVTFDFATRSLRFDTEASAQLQKLQEQLKDGEFFLTSLGTTIWRTFAEIEPALS